MQKWFAWILELGSCSSLDQNRECCKSLDEVEWISTKPNKIEMKKTPENLRTPLFRSSKSWEKKNLSVFLTNSGMMSPHYKFHARNYFFEEKKTSSILMHRINSFISPAFMSKMRTNVQ